LGEVGQGHKIAFNILNMGRFALAAGVTGGSKSALRQTVAYAKERKQFGKTLTEFGLIQQKLARMATAVFVAESMVYRSGGLISEALGAAHQEAAQVVAALEEYAIECSINKVFASEVLDFVVDEMVQVHGGYGFIEEYPAARAYRDARINRLFEGTNEINRLLIPAMLFRRALKGRLNLLAAAQKVAGEMLAPAAGNGEMPGPLADERRLVEGARRATLFAAGAAAQKYLTDLEHQQEILGWIADLAIEVFAAESAVLRAAKTSTRGGATAELQTAMVRLHLDEALPRVEATARRILAATEEGDTLRTMLAGLRRFLRVPSQNAAALSRQVARAVIGAGRYVA
jgi:butyryl-CoA dehydrogenase